MKPEDPQSKKRTKKYEWLRWLGTLATLPLFIWLLARQNWGLVWMYLQKVPGWVFLLALGLYMVGLLANAARWQILLGVPNIPIGFKDTLKIVFSGVFASNFLPSTIGGDAVRFVGLQRFTADKVVNLASIVLDRVVNLTAFLTVLPLTFVTFGSALPLSFHSSTQVDPFSGLILSLSVSFPKKLRSRLKDWMNRIYGSFLIWLRKPGWLAVAFAVSWFSIFVIFLAIWLLARSLGIPVTLAQVMGVTVITYLATLLPISVNGYGLREILVTGLYTYLGASVEQASLLAVMTRFMSMLVTLPGALWIGPVLVNKNDPTLNDPPR